MPTRSSVGEVAWCWHCFMWGHVVLVGSILTGERGFDWMATFLEDYYIAQPTVIVNILPVPGSRGICRKKDPGTVARTQAHRASSPKV